VFPGSWNSEEAHGFVPDNANDVASNDYDIRPVTGERSGQTTVVPNAVAVAQRSVNIIPVFRVIEAAGLDPRPSEEYVGAGSGNCGAVVSQAPVAGSRVPVGSDVLLNVRDC
jgi:hypothetical protein